MGANLSLLPPLSAGSSRLRHTCRKSKFETRFSAKALKPAKCLYPIAEAPRTYLGPKTCTKEDLKVPQNCNFFIENDSTWLKWGGLEIQVGSPPSRPLSLLLCFEPTCNEAVGWYYTSPQPGYHLPNPLFVNFSSKFCATNRLLGEKPPFR